MVVRNMGCDIAYDEAITLRAGPGRHPRAALYELAGTDFGAQRLAAMAIWGTSDRFASSDPAVGPVKAMCRSGSCEWQLCGKS
jgi:hypothetical protein